MRAAASGPGLRSRAPHHSRWLAGWLGSIAARRPGGPPVKQVVVLGVRGSSTWVAADVTVTHNLHFAAPPMHAGGGAHHRLRGKPCARREQGTPCCCRCRYRCAGNTRQLCSRPLPRRPLCMQAAAVQRLRHGWPRAAGCAACRPCSVQAAQRAGCAAKVRGTSEPGSPLAPFSAYFRCWRLCQRPTHPS